MPDSFIVDVGNDNDSVVLSDSLPTSNHYKLINTLYRERFAASHVGGMASTLNHCSQPRGRHGIYVKPLQPAT